MEKRLCRGQPVGGNVWKDAGVHSVHYYDAFCGVRPTKVKRMRLKCSVCGRKLLSSISVCHDGCHIIHTLPPHKPKGWWKKTKTLKKKKMNRKGRA